MHWNITPNKKKSKHLAALNRLDSAIRQAKVKFQDRFQFPPSKPISDEIEQRVRKEHRLKPFMGTQFYTGKGKNKQYRSVCAYSHWHAGRNSKAQIIRFCWSARRNEAGYFLFWQELLYNNKTISTSRWGARKVKTRAKEISHQRMLKWRERHAGNT